jgi:uncharacterized linocin/CFP29 family protein
MDRLRRELAPISEKAWGLIDEEAARTLRHFLAARRLVDHEGPYGWEYAAKTLARVEATAGPDGVDAKLRVVQPAVELRTPFTLDLAELDQVERGTSNPDLDPVIDAAHRIALAEDQIVFEGGSAGLEGIAAVSAHDPLQLTDDYDAYPRYVAQAVARLRRAGISGPYAIALGDRCYTGVIETTEHGGYPVLEHVSQILGGPVIWAPAVDGAVVVSQRGGDYEFVSGADFAVGYTSHSATSVDLYLEESFVFLVHERRAAIALRYS